MYKAKSATACSNVYVCALAFVWSSRLKIKCVCKNTNTSTENENIHRTIRLDVLWISVLAQATYGLMVFTACCVYTLHTLEPVWKI